MAPECFTWLFGLFSDSVRIFGYKRKGHLLIASAIQFLIGVAIVLVSLTRISDRETGLYWTVGLASVLTASKTWMVPVIETMMVVEMKKNLVRGAEDALTYSYFFYTMGAIYYGLVGSLVWWLT